MDDKNIQPEFSLALRSDSLILFPLGDMNARAILILYLLPAFLTAVLLLVRYRGSIRSYAVSAAACIAVAFGLWRWLPVVTLHYSGPLNAYGFASFAFVPAFISMCAVCALPPVYVWRFFQPLVSMFLAVYWFTYYTWIA